MYKNSIPTSIKSIFLYLFGKFALSNLKMKSATKLTKLENCAIFLLAKTILYAYIFIMCVWLYLILLSFHYIDIHYNRRKR